MNKQQITEQLLENHRQFVDDVSALSESDFMLSANGKWTAGQQLEHLIRGVSPIKLAFTLPKFVPRLLFGKSDRISINYPELVTNYQGKLATGSKASRKFIPPEIVFEKRQLLQNKLLKVVGDLTAKLDNFSEEQLDRYLLPHPILGKLTMREMLYFTIYHCEHHQLAMLRNLGQK
jgi:hypothetical protein